MATAAIGAGIGAVIGGGATIASSLVKGEKINWKNVGKNAAIGAVSGAVIGSGVGLAAAVAEATIVSSAAAATMTTCAGVVGTITSTIEAGRQIVSDENIDMFKISSAGAAGAVSGMVTGSPIGRMGSAIFNGGIAITQSIANDIHDGKGGLEIAIDAAINGGLGFVGGLFGGAGAMKDVMHSAEVTNVLFGMEKSHLFIYGRQLSSKAVEEYVKKSAIWGVLKGIIWTLGVTTSQEVYDYCTGE